MCTERENKIKKWKELRTDILLRVYGYKWCRYGALNLSCELEKAMETKIDIFEIESIILNRLKYFPEVFLPQK